MSQVVVAPTSRSHYLHNAVTCGDCPNLGGVTHVDHELQDGNFADDTPVFVRYPRKPEEERGDRAKWPWLRGNDCPAVRPG